MTSLGYFKTRKLHLSDLPVYSGGKMKKSGQKSEKERQQKAKRAAKRVIEKVKKTGKKAKQEKIKIGVKIK